MKIDIKYDNSSQYWINNGWGTPVRAEVTDFEGSIDKLGTYVRCRLKYEIKENGGYEYVWRSSDEMFEDKLTCVKICLGVSDDVDEALI